jgi:hypothetical protein
MNKNKILNIALHKISKIRPNFWTGYLTPVEILLLIENGIIPTENQIYKIDICKEEKKKGISGGIWFYFHLSKKFIKKYGHKLKDNP